MKRSDFTGTDRALFTKCNWCGQRVSVDPTLLPPQFDLDDLAGRLKCAKCGSRDMTAILQTAH